jgi:hypothetical protein
VAGVLLTPNITFRLKQYERKYLVRSSGSVSLGQTPMLRFFIYGCSISDQ